MSNGRKGWLRAGAGGGVDGASCTGDGAVTQYEAGDERGPVFRVLRRRGSRLAERALRFVPCPAGDGSDRLPLVGPPSPSRRGAGVQRGQGKRENTWLQVRQIRDAADVGVTRVRGTSGGGEESRFFGAGGTARWRRRGRGAGEEGLAVRGAAAAGWGAL